MTPQPSGPARWVVLSAEWTLSAETAEGAPRGIFHASCLDCGAESGLVDNQRETVEAWALRHTGRHPAHRQFTFHSEWFWRVSPAPGNPLYDLEHGDAEAGP